MIPESDQTPDEPESTERRAEEILFIGEVERKTADGIEASPYKSPETLTKPEADSPPRIASWRDSIPPWLSSSLMPVLAIGLAFTLAVVTLLFAVLVGPGFDALRTDPTNTIREITSSPWGLAALALPGQLAFVTCALVGALLSRERIVDRLNLTAGRAPVGLWLIFLLATPLVGMVISLLFSLLPIEPSAQLKEMEQMMHADSVGRLMMLFLLISLMPGFCEELLFRGYIQSRLTKVWWVSLGVIYTSVFFAIAHMDPMHVVLVFPLGIWLGLVSWRCGSIWPAVLCHAGNNAFSLVQVQLVHHGVVEESDGLTRFDMGLMIFSAFFMIIAMISILEYASATRDASDVASTG